MFCGIVMFTRQPRPSWGYQTSLRLTRSAFLSYNSKKVRAEGELEHSGRLLWTLGPGKNRSGVKTWWKILEPQGAWLEEEGNWAGGDNDLQQRAEAGSRQPVSPGSFPLGPVPPRSLLMLVAHLPLHREQMSVFSLPTPPALLYPLPYPLHSAQSWKLIKCQPHRIQGWWALSLPHPRCQLGADEMYKGWSVT